jgi:hypothetical protein
LTSQPPPKYFPVAPQKDRHHYLDFAAAAQILSKKSSAAKRQTPLSRLRSRRPNTFQKKQRRKKADHYLKMTFRDLFDGVLAALLFGATLIIKGPVKKKRRRKKRKKRKSTVALTIVDNIPAEGAARAPERARFVRVPFPTRFRAGDDVHFESSLSERHTLFVESDEEGPVYIVPRNDGGLMVTISYPWATFANNCERKRLLKQHLLKCRCTTHSQKKLDVAFESLPFHTRFLGGIKREIDSNNALCLLYGTP